MTCFFFDDEISVISTFFGKKMIFAFMSFVVVLNPLSDEQKH